MSGGGIQNYSKNLIRKNKRLNSGLKTQKKKRRKKRKNKYNKYNEYNNTLKINMNPSHKKSKKNILINNTSLKRK